MVVRVTLTYEDLEPEADSGDHPLSNWVAPSDNCKMDYRLEIDFDYLMRIIDRVTVGRYG
jgi:hypothetical protein